MRISVVISSYNHAAYLRECVQSVLDQTLPAAEVIVVDDGSTDDSRGIIASFGSRITPVFQENRGTYAALNAGVAVASGDWIAIHNSDDAWMPQKLDRQAALAAEHPEVGLIHTSFVCIDTLGVEFPRPSTVTDYHGPPIEELLPRMLHTMPVVISSAIFPRRVWEECGPFDERYYGAGDTALCLRISARYPFGFVDEPLVRLRKHPDNSGTNRSRLPETWHRRDWKLLCERELPAAARRLFEKSQSGEISADEAAIALASLAVIHTRSGEPRLARSCLSMSIRLKPARWQTWLRFAAALLARPSD